MARGKRPDLKSEEKNVIAQFLLTRSTNGVINTGAQKAAALKFGVSINTVKNIWKATKTKIGQGEAIYFQNNRKGKTHKDLLLPDKERIKQLSVLDRTSLRKMAFKLNISKSIIGRWVQQKRLRPHTNAIKPSLTDINKITRLKFCLSFLKCDSITHTYSYDPMQNIVHIDEKWFDITKKSDRYYLLPEEEEPYRCCKSKKFLTKIMFLCAVGRPLFNSEGEVIFDGKIGIFPFIEQVPAIRNSKNRCKGTLCTKAINSVTKSVIKAHFLNQVVPTIKAKWPEFAGRDIIIQQDNAKPHLKSTDQELMAACNSDGFRINQLNQPTNSPDTNILDLGFFRAIQTLQDQKPAKNVDDLLKNVMDAFEEQDATTLNKVFLTLQGCFTEIMKQRGGNKYKVPHMNKQALIREGTLPISLQVEEELIRECLDYLKEHEIEAGSCYDLAALKRALG